MAAKGKLQTKSAASFFADNKNIAGFDNPGKSLYTTIRELVENGLDAAENMHVLPDISVQVEQISVEAYHRTIGLKERDRIDEVCGVREPPSARRRVPASGRASRQN